VSACVVSLDLSLRSTGWASSDGRSGTVPPPSDLDDYERIRWLRDVILGLVEDAHLVVVEGAAYGGARGTTRLHAAGELSGVVRLALLERGIAVAEVPPAVVKKVATGKGNAPKDQILAAAIRRLGYTGHSRDEADALWLLQAALHHLGLPGRVDLPKAHVSTLGTAVRWPEVAPGPEEEP